MLEAQLCLCCYPKSSLSASSTFRTGFTSIFSFLQSMLFIPLCGISMVVKPSFSASATRWVILATGRIVGETAALLFTAGTVAQIPSSLFGSGRTLALHMYALSNEGLHVNEAYATAVVLLVLVLLINGLSNVIAGKFTKA